MDKRNRPPDIAEQLRRAVMGCGLSLNGLAKVTGVHQANLSRFVRGERSLSLPAAAKLCSYLGLALTGPALTPRPGVSDAK
jgi:plasmid maintenance system antidote protein VapI